MKRRELIKSVAVFALASFSLASGIAAAFDGPELYAGEKALYEAAQKEGLVVSFAVPRIQETLSRYRDHLQRHRIGSDGCLTGQKSSPSAGRHGLLLRSIRGRCRQEGRRRIIQTDQLRKTTRRIPRRIGKMVHDPYIECGVPGQYEARQERADELGRSTQA